MITSRAMLEAAIAARTSLAGETLADLDLDGLVAEALDLSGAHLTRVTAREAVLRSVNFVNAHLEGVFRMIWRLFSLESGFLHYPIPILYK